MVEGPEKACEEEYFRDDKENYSITETFLNDRRVVTLECAFSNNISSPLIYSQQVGGYT